MGLLNCRLLIGTHLESSSSSSLVRIKEIFSSAKYLPLAMINMSTFCASIMVCVIYDSFVIFCRKVNTSLAIRERFVQKVTLLVGKNHFFGSVCIDSVTELHPLMTAVGSPVIDSVYSTVTLFARFLGISTSRPLSTAT